MDRGGAILEATKQVPLRLVDEIYEAAFSPDLWPSVLESLNALSGSASGAFLVYAEREAPRWRGTDVTQEALHDFHGTGDWQRTEKPSRYFASRQTSFVCDVDLLTPEELRSDPINKRLSALGLGWQTAAMLPMPGDRVGFITFERRIADGRHRPAEIAALEQLRPHFAHAVHLSARLSLAPAETAVATLEAIGLPAVVLAGSGRVLAVNGLVPTLASILRPAAHGGIAISDPSADALFREALAATPPLIRSIPVAAKAGREAALLHMLPIRGAAHDIFSGAAVLLVATAVNMSGNAPSIQVLQGLFDLSPAEARLAAALASGRTLSEAAVAQGIRFSTARAYLKSIFLKTGTHQQSQLVAVLKSTRPLNQ